MVKVALERKPTLLVDFDLEDPYDTAFLEWMVDLVRPRYRREGDWLVATRVPTVKAERWSREENFHVLVTDPTEFVGTVAATIESQRADAQIEEPLGRTQD